MGTLIIVDTIESNLDAEITVLLYVSKIAWTLCRQKEHGDKSGMLPVLFVCMYVGTYNITCYYVDRLLITTPGSSFCGWLLA